MRDRDREREWERETTQAAEDKTVGLQFLLGLVYRTCRTREKNWKTQQQKTETTIKTIFSGLFQLCGEEHKNILDHQTLFLLKILMRSCTDITQTPEFSCQTHSCAIMYTSHAEMTWNLILTVHFTKVWLACCSIRNIKTVTISSTWIWGLKIVCFA